MVKSVLVLCISIDNMIHCDMYYFMYVFQLDTEENYGRHAHILLQSS